MIILKEIHENSMINKKSEDLEFTGSYVAFHVENRI